MLLTMILKQSHNLFFDLLKGNKITCKENVKLLGVTIDSQLLNPCSPWRAGGNRLNVWLTEDGPLPS